MTSILKLLAGLTIFAVTAGCVHQPIQPAPEPVEKEEIQFIQAPEDDLVELMRYFDALQGKTKAEILEEYNYANSHYRESANLLQRLKLVLLLLLPDTGFQSNRVALGLMENLPAQFESTAATITFKDLLVMLLKRQRAANVQIENLSEKLRSTEAEVEMLKSKIDAIKHIEKQLMRKITP